MTRISRSALLPHPARAMFDLVNDVEAYPRYMDGCVGAEVLARSDTEMLARLDLARSGLRQSLTTRNRLEPPSRIDMVLVQGPFRRFSGGWTFQPLGEGACKVSLELDFDYSGRLLGGALRLMLNKLADNLVEALVRRADELYGRQADDQG